MNTNSAQPDDTDVVATLSDAAGLRHQPLLVLDRVEDFLNRHGIGIGPLSWARIGDGQSNVTFRIIREGADVVLRRGPRPPLPKSTHDMVREARIQTVLADHHFPVPHIQAVCEDDSILGVPFYVMSYLGGTVITDDIPRSLNTPANRLATSEAVVDTLVELHTLDVSTSKLSTLGRPEGYLRRQVERFAALWEGNTRRDIPEVAKLAHWLEANRPTTQRHSLIHGDYRMGNLMFERGTEPRVAALLDWEMATLGDPLADLGYLTATYAEPGEPGTTMELTSVTRQQGYLRRAELGNRYHDQMGLDLDALPWYQTLALWKAAIFSEAIYTRWLEGERPEDTTFSTRLEAGVPALLKRAQRFSAHLP